MNEIDFHKDAYSISVKNIFSWSIIFLYIAAWIGCCFYSIHWITLYLYECVTWIVLNFCKLVGVL